MKNKNDAFCFNCGNLEIECKCVKIRKKKNDAFCFNCGNLEIECKCVKIRKKKTKQSNNEYEKLLKE